MSMSNTLLTQFNLDRYKEHYGAGHWRNETIYDLVLRQATTWPDSPAITTSHSRCTYGQLLSAADNFASDLASRGILPGQRVAVWLPSRIETVIALLACSRNGYVCCPSLHRDHTAPEIVALLDRMRARAAVAEAGYGADADKRDFFTGVANVTTIQQVYRLEKSRSRQPIGIGAFTKSIPVSKPARSDPNRVLYLAFTSGTTGIPKGVMHSDNTLLANARALAADWNITSSSVVYSMSPLSHNLGFGSMIMALAVGAEIVLHDLPRGQSLVDRILETDTSFLVGVPTHAIDLLDELKSRNLSGLGRLNGFRISGAAAPSEVISGLLDCGIVPQSGYGMTETCSHQYTRPNDSAKLIVESCGKACANYEVRIFDRENPDREVPVGEIGQIGGRGASLMLGYFDDQTATEDSFNASGWFMTGDLGWVDESGYLRITGRKKDVIIRGGHNIFPAKIEALASAHPAVQRAVAVPISDPRLGERVCLAVMFHSGATATAEKILEHLDNLGLSIYDMPEYFIEVPDIPFTASGKVRKRDIADEIAAGKLQPTAVRWKAKVKT